MADVAELKNMIRLGTVMSIDKEKMTARVKFADKGGIISGSLHVLKRPEYIIPTPESERKGQTAETTLEYDIRDKTNNVKHYHEADISPWIPQVNTMVLCIMLPDGDGDGFILGEV